MTYICAAERADLEGGGDYETKHADSVEEAAVEFAEWAWDNMDGWEWLRDDGEVYVLSETGEVQRVGVAVDFEPVFWAKEPEAA